MIWHLNRCVLHMSPNWLSKACISHCLSPNPDKAICTWPEGITSDVESLAGVLLQFPTFLVLVFVVSANGNTPTNNHSALKARKVPVTADMYETESPVFFQACTRHICAHTHEHTHTYQDTHSTNTHRLTDGWSPERPWSAALHVHNPDTLLGHSCLGRGIGGRTSGPLAALMVGFQPDLESVRDCTNIISRKQQQ